MTGTAARDFTGGSWAPRRDRPVNARIVPCPVCRAGVGEHCVTSQGNPIRHKARRRMALRAESAVGA